MKFKSEIKTPDGQVLSAHFGDTQENADFTARYTNLCVLRFKAMPIDLIQSMPESGVPGMAIECTNGIAAIEALEGILEIATTHSEDAWMALRQRFILDKKLRDPDKTH